MNWNRFGVIASVLGTSVSSIALIIAVFKLKPLPAILLGMVFTIVITMVIYKIIPGNVINVDVKLIRAIKIIIDMKEQDKGITKEIKSLFVNNYGVLEGVLQRFSELRKTKDWKIPLKEKMDLREYFEKSGNYTVGANLGEKYYEVLVELEYILESLWIMVNMIGFLRIQSNDYSEGRQKLKTAEKKLEEIWEKRGRKIRKIKEKRVVTNDKLKDKYQLLLKKKDLRYRIERILHSKKEYRGFSLKFLIECIFYCRRYLGISYQRAAKIEPDKAEDYFRKAEEILKYLEYDNDYNALNAKIQVNLGNLLHTRGKLVALSGNRKESISYHKKALEKFTNALRIFGNMTDMKRIASESLHIIEVLLHLPRHIKFKEIETHLKNAESVAREIGWKEGQARTYKYYSLYYEQQGDKTKAHLKEKKRCLQNALDYAKKSLDLYKEIKKTNEIEKLEPRIKEIEQKLLPMITTPQQIDDAIAQKIGDDIKFLKAILDILEPGNMDHLEKRDDKLLRHQFSSIISKQYGRLQSEFQKLEQKKDWNTLLRAKEVLREFFEYSGKYKEGVSTGRIYYKALKASKNDIEAIWAKVKHIGYLLVLNGDHLVGRNELNEALAELSELTDRNSDPVVECYFYCHRYLGISYHRDSLKADLDKAEEHYRRAEEYTSHFKGRTGKYNELIARIKGNMGNLAMSKGDHLKALGLFKQSHAMFLDLGDKEHIGIAKLQMVEALLYLRTHPEYENVPTYLGEANVLFNEIGWIEGQGRCQKYYAYFYMFQLEKVPALTPAQEKLIREALNYAKLGKASYTQIDKKKEVGKLEGRIEMLEQNLREMKS